MPSLSLKPGARLVREWRGQTHTVAVTEDGFEYAGKSYASLTRIAKEITGAHWSGPLMRKASRLPVDWRVPECPPSGIGDLEAHDLDLFVAALLALGVGQAANRKGLAPIEVQSFGPSPLRSTKPHRRRSVG